MSPYDKLPLDGYKMFMVGLASFLIGVSGLVLRFAGVEEYSLGIEEARGLILFGLGFLGFGHKLEKVLEKLKGGT